MNVRITQLRRDEEAERDKPVRVSGVTVDYTPLDALPDIRLAFVVGGGTFMSFDYLIVGGPDDGKRITLVPWRPRWSLEHVASAYNGTPAEAEAAYGYTSRPAVTYSGTLHVSTVQFLRGMLKEEREHLMAKALTALYDAQTQAEKELFLSARPG